MSRFFLTSEEEEEKDDDEGVAEVEEGGCDVLDIQFSYEIVNAIDE